MHHGNVHHGFDNHEKTEFQIGPMGDQWNIGVTRTVLYILVFPLGYTIAATTPCHALFQHLNFQKCSGRDFFGVVLTWKCSSRRNGVQVFISQIAPHLPLEGAHKSPEQNQCLVTFLCSRACMFLLPTLSFLWFFSLSLLFSNSFYLCTAFYLSIIARSLTSKLPSITGLAINMVRRTSSVHL